MNARSLRTRLLGGLLLAALLPTCGGAPQPAPTAAKTPAPAPEPVPEPEPVVEPEPVKPPDPPTEVAATKVKAAVAVAREISADPEHADEILARHGLDREKLDAMMYEIAADPALTDAYMAARRAS